MKDRKAIVLFNLSCVSFGLHFLFLVLPNKVIFSPLRNPCLLHVFLTIPHDLCKDLGEMGEASHFVLDPVNMELFLSVTVEANMTSRLVSSCGREQNQSQCNASSTSAREMSLLHATGLVQMIRCHADLAKTTSLSP